MATKQITELDEADILEEGDLILVRKTGMAVDQSLPRAKLIESIGNTAVSGYTATSNFENKITLTASNSALVPEYFEGMKISFISPIETDALVEVQIGALSFINLHKYNVNETVALEQNEYVEAVYTNGEFKQTNKLNTNLIWSNEYTATGEVTGLSPNEVTTYSLTSAIGVTKPNYYAGMSLLFTTPIDSKGVVFVNVDGLGNKQLNDGNDDLLVNDIYKTQAIMAIYDGTQFVKQKFSSIEREPIIIDIEEPEIIIPPVVEEDIWAPSYNGDPDDPANADSPDSVDSQGKRFFNRVLTVGPSGTYKKLPEAIAALINDYGDTGSGNRYAIKLLSNYVPDDAQLFIQGRSKTADLRWISIVSEGNSFINFNKTYLYCICDYTPIFNFKMSINRTANVSTSSWNWAFYISDSKKKTVVTFGKKTDIIFSSTGAGNRTNQVLWGNPDIVALYGITVKSTNPFTFGNYFINKGSFTYENVSSASGHSFFNCIAETNSKIYNSTFSCATGIASTMIQADARASLYLQNVESSDRESTTKGVVSAADLTMQDCRFASNTVGSQTGGHDIVINGNTETRLLLKNTTGKTNQAIGEQTNNGKIIVVS